MLARGQPSIDDRSSRRRKDKMNEMASIAAGLACFFRAHIVLKVEVREFA
jgi:hypothetical protein